MKELLNTGFIDVVVGFVLAAGAFAYTLEAGWKIRVTVNKSTKIGILFLKKFFIHGYPPFKMWYYITLYNNIVKKYI